ncbi:MAG: hypothetical protein V3S24_23115, partial [Candidatus Tectomicrobia bacterium]
MATGQLVDRMEQAAAQACSWKQGPHTLGSAVEAIGEDPLNLIGWLVLVDGASPPSAFLSAPQAAALHAAPRAAARAAASCRRDELQTDDHMHTDRFGGKNAGQEGLDELRKLEAGQYWPEVRRVPGRAALQDRRRVDREC